MLLLEACCLLNLYATDRLREIAVTPPHRLGVAQYVLAQESLYVRRPVPSAAREERIRIDLSSLVREDLVQVLHLEHPLEERLFVDLAALVDDGEATTGAIALNRGYAIAMDDRKARRVFTEHMQTVRLISTLEIMKNWADRATVSNAELRAAMVRIRSGTGYVPSKRDPLYDWGRKLTYSGASWC